MEVVINSVQKTTIGNVIGYSIKADAGETPILVSACLVKSKSTHNRWSGIGSMADPSSVQEGMNYSSFVDGWTATRREKRTYKIKVMNAEGELVESEEFTY